MRTGHRTLTRTALTPEQGKPLRNTPKNNEHQLGGNNHSQSLQLVPQLDTSELAGILHRARRPRHILLIIVGAATLHAQVTAVTAAAIDGVLVEVPAAQLRGAFGDVGDPVDDLCVYVCGFQITYRSFHGASANS